MSNKLYYFNNLNKIITIEKLVSIFYSDWNPKFTSRGEKHDFWEFIYVDKESISIISDDKKLILNQGEIYFHSPNEYHRHDSIPNSYPSICIVSFTCNNEIMNSLANKKLYVSEHCQELLSKTLKYGTDIFASVVDEKEKFIMLKKSKYNILNEQLLANYLEIFLLEMINLINNPNVYQQEVKNPTSSIVKNQKKQLVDNAINYLEQHVYSKVTIPQMCAALNCSKTSLSTAFKNHMKMTIIEYLNRLKIDKAKEIIKTQDLNLTEIANLLNFCNINYFSNSFKNYVGMYPSEYAKSIKVRNHSYMVAAIPHDLNKQ